MLEIQRLQDAHRNEINSLKLSFQELPREDQFGEITERDARIAALILEVNFLRESREAAIDEVEELISSLDKARETSKNLALRCTTFEREKELHAMQTMDFTPTSNLSPLVDSSLENILNERLTISPEDTTPPEAPSLEAIPNLNSPVAGLVPMTDAIRRTADSGQKRPRSEERSSQSPAPPSSIGRYSNRGRGNK